MSNNGPWWHIYVTSFIYLLNGGWTHLFRWVVDFHLTMFHRWLWWLNQIIVASHIQKDHPTHQLDFHLKYIILTIVLRLVVVLQRDDGWNRSVENTCIRIIHPTRIGFGLNGLAYSNNSNLIHIGLGVKYFEIRVTRITRIWY